MTDVNNIAVVRGSPSSICVAADEGLIKSTYNGDSWTVSNLSYQFITADDPSTPQKGLCRVIIKWRGHGRCGHKLKYYMRFLLC